MHRSLEHLIRDGVEDSVTLQAENGEIQWKVQRTIGSECKSVGFFRQAEGCNGQILFEVWILFEVITNSGRSKITA